MVLNGTLEEFILADILNMLMLHKATGHLLLTDEKREGSIIFRSGNIAGAECGDENLSAKLFKYMVDIRRIPADCVNLLFNAHTDNLQALAADILERSMMTSNEFKCFAKRCVEDICCGLLAWERGAYRFNSMQCVTALICGTVAIPPENIILEGMRRADEWARMRGF